MRKEELVQALLRHAKSSSGNAGGPNGDRRKRSVTATAVKGRRVKSKATKSTKRKPVDSKPTPKQRKVARQIRKVQEHRNDQKDLAQIHERLEPGTDRIILMVRDPYWLHAYWELTSQTVQRARMALAEHWHSSRPILRLLTVSADSNPTHGERVAREIPIHGGVKHWYIDVAEPPQTYRVEIGYLATNGKFIALSSSNTVTTPTPGTIESADDNWTDVAKNCEKIFALSGGYSEDAATQELQELFEERLRHPLGSPMVTRYGIGAEMSLKQDRAFRFELDAEMVVYGVTEPDAHITLGGEPVKLQPDGTFLVRVSMPDRRQVLPAVASSADGMEQQTIVIAVERNTKVMEPFVRDSAG